jgi:hypothetical protein
VSKDIPYSNISANQNPYNYAQVAIGGNSSSSRLYLGAAYTSGAGAGSVIQASDYFSSTDNGVGLFLNPKGGGVAIGSPTATAYSLDVNGVIQGAVYYSTITVGGIATVTPNNFGIFYNITTSGTYTLAFSASQASSNIGKYVVFRNNSGVTLSLALTGVSGITSPVTLSNAQSATIMVATTTTYALF